MQSTKGDRQRRQHFADVASGHARLLPGETEMGKLCFLSTDGRPSVLSRLADQMETIQLGADVLKAASKDEARRRGVGQGASRRGGW